MIDPMVLDPGGLTTLDAWQPSWEGDLLAIQTSKAGREQGALVVLDVATGDRVDGPIAGVRYSPVAWLPGGDAFTTSAHYPIRTLRPCSYNETAGCIVACGCTVSAPTPPKTRSSLAPTKVSPHAQAYRSPQMGGGWWSRSTTEPERETTCGWPS